jgi:hypothetical protein
MEETQEQMRRERSGMKDLDRTGAEGRKKDATSRKRESSRYVA